MNLHITLKVFGLRGGATEILTMISAKMPFLATVYQKIEQMCMPVVHSN